MTMSIGARALLVVAFLMALSTPLMAAGPVDGSVGVVWWANEFSSTGGATTVDETDGDALGFYGELWFVNRYGIRAQLFTSDLDDISQESADYQSIDFVWKAFAPTSNNYFGIGAGYQEFDLDAIGLADSTSGIRINAEAQVSLVGQLVLYGRGAYLPELDEGAAIMAADGNFDDMEGYEYELGVAFRIFPFVKARAGIRKTYVEFVRTDATDARFDGEAESEGYFAGLSVHF